jgi:hypothetical protein
MSGITPWVPTLTPINDGEQVRQSVANRMPQQIAQRTQNLKEILDSLLAGTALVARDVAVETGVLVGHAVYFHAASQEYRRAIAAVDYDPVSGAYVPSASSFVAGVCLWKHTGTRADIVQLGITPLDWTNAIGSAGNTPAEAGAYYLSGTIPGRLTKQKPPVSVFVAYLHGDTYGQVLPTPRDVLEQHVHYAFSLYAQPAGVVACTAPNNPYTFLSVDPTSPGWLPDSDPVFGGMAPAGAVYGYNLAQHPALQKIWPPMPLGSCYVEMNGVGVPAGRFSADCNGLWWYDSCYGRAPWPTTEGCSSSSSSSSPSSSSSSSPSSSSSSSPSSSASPAEICDSGPTLEQLGFVRVDPAQRTLKLYFTKMVFKTDNSVVTSLTRNRSAIPVQLFGCDKTATSRTGDIYLDFILDLLYSEGHAGSAVIKRLVQTPEGQLTAVRGPVVEGLLPGAFITLAGNLNPLTGAYNGLVTVNNDPSFLQVRDLAVALVSLDNVRQDFKSDLFYLAFPRGKTSQFRGRVDLPTTLITADMVLRLSFWILALDGTVLTSQAVPALQMSHRILSDPGAPCAVQTLLTVDTALVPLATCDAAVNEYFKIDSYDIAGIVNGDQVFFTLKRVYDVALDTYGDIGILRMQAQLVKPSSSSSSP